MRAAQSLLPKAFLSVSRTRSIASIVTTRFPSRQYWTRATTSSHPDLATALAETLSQPSSSPSPPSSTKTVAIVLASRSYPGQDLLTLPSKLPSYLTSQFGIPENNITVLSAVVDRVPTDNGHGVSTLLISSDALSKHVVPFYLSGQESRRKRLKDKSVGKWARAEDIQERSLDTADAWSAFKSISIGQNQVRVPENVLEAYQTASATKGLNKDVFVISDREVHQFLGALDVQLPDANKLGVIASSTPFVTGKPMTMFVNDQMVQDGVMGVFAASEQSSSAPLSSSSAVITHPTLSTMGPAMTITKCRGNIILGLDGNNATQLLLERIEGSTDEDVRKDKEYFLATAEAAVLDLSANEDLPLENLSEEDAAYNIDLTNAMVHKITGGDPSKGNMAVDMVHDLQEGHWVQFLHHDEHTIIDRNRSPHKLRNTNDKTSTITLTVSNPDRLIDDDYLDLSTITNSIVDHNIFGGSSENGFIVGRPQEPTWICLVNNSTATLTKQPKAETGAAEI